MQSVFINISRASSSLYGLDEGERNGMVWMRGGRGQAGQKREARVGWVALINDDLLFICLSICHLSSHEKLRHSRIN